MATIEIRSKETGFFETQHMYIIYTNDAGEKMILRGGPEGRSLLKTFTGDILVQNVAYNDQAPDWDYDDKNLRQTLFTGTDAEMQSKIDLAIVEMNRINSEGYDYNLPLIESFIPAWGDLNEQNSNTVAVYLANAMGLKQGVIDFVWDKNLNVPGYLSSIEHSDFEKTTSSLWQGLLESYQDVKNDVLIISDFVSDVIDNFKSDYDSSTSTLIQENSDFFGELLEVSIGNNFTIKYKDSDGLEHVIESGVGRHLVIGDNEANDTVSYEDATNGKIIINNQTIIGTATLINAENPNLYQLAIGANIYLLTKSGNDLIIVNQGDPENESAIQNQVTIKDFNSGNLGITLSDDPDEGNGEFPKINHVYVGNDSTNFSVNGNSLIYGGVNNDNKNNYKNFSNQNFQTIQKSKNRFINLMICFLVIMFSISIPKTSYSMSFFAKKELSNGTKDNPYQLPISIPIDITKKGNRLEFYVEVKEEYKYAFMIKFLNKHRSIYSKTLDILYKSDLTSWILMVVPPPKIDKKERNDHDLVAKSTPFHIMVVKIEDDKEVVIFDKIVEPKFDSWGKTFDKVFGDVNFNKNHTDFGIYKISVEATKDNPDFVNKEIYFGINRSYGEVLVF